MGGKGAVQPAVREGQHLGVGLEHRDGQPVAAGLRLRLTDHAGRPIKACHPCTGCAQRRLDIPWATADIHHRRATALHQRGGEQWIPVRRALAVAAMGIHADAESLRIAVLVGDMSGRLRGRSSILRRERKHASSDSVTDGCERARRNSVTAALPITLPRTGAGPGG